ncbi:GDSL-type esterase/lipase family protein [Mycoplasma corogypsi]|uniref:GDSL-type esterase/lipase family protein n=1 Tax=Mycoplasma corogypsi TaxID=2106 RepID=UPI003873976F
MKNKFKKLTALGAFLSSMSLVAACAAPGSSKEIERGDAGFTKPEDISGKAPTHKEGEFEIRTKDSAEATSNSNATENLHSIRIERRVNRRVSRNLIGQTQKVKYIALGDSITAGFDGSLPQDYPGEFKNNRVTGASYPAFLANTFAKMNRLESFNNYAVSGSTAIDWLQLFGVSAENGDARIFKGNALGNIDKAKVLRELRDANLVTLSIGFNDFLFLLIKSIAEQDLTIPIKNLLLDKPILQNTITFVNSVLNSVNQVLNNNLNKLFQTLRAKAPNANINVIAYPEPFLAVGKIIQQKISQVIGREVNVVQLVTDTVNNIIRQNALKNNLNFVETFNRPFWESDVNTYSSVFLDIHPSTKAYKKMAMDLYMKIASPANGGEGFDPYPEFTSEYLDKDFQNVEYQFESTVSPTTLFGDSTANYIAKNEVDEARLASLKSPANFGKRLTSFSLVYKQVTLEVLHYLTNNEIYRTLDPEMNFNKILFTEVNGTVTFRPEADRIVKKLVNSDFVQQMFTDAQNGIADLVKRNELTFDSFASLMGNIFANEQTAVKLIKFLSKNEFVNQHRETFKRGLKNVLYNGMVQFGPKILDLFFDKLVPTLNSIGLKSTEQLNQFKTLFVNVAKSEELKTLINKLVDTYSDNAANFDDENVRTFSDLLIALISRPSTANVSGNNLKAAIDKYNNQINELSTAINNLVFKMLADGKDLFAGALVQLFTDNKLLTNESQKNDYKRFVSDLLNFTITNVKDLGIVKDAVSNMLLGIAGRTQNSAAELLGGSLIQASIPKFDLSNQNNWTGIFKLLTKFADSPVFSNQANKNVLKQLLKNILYNRVLTSSNTPLNLQNAINLVPVDIRQSLSKFLSAANVEKFLTILINADNAGNGRKNLANFIDVVVDNIFSNIQRFKNLTSPDQLVARVWKVLISENSINPIINLVKNVANNSQISSLLVNLVQQVLLNGYQIPNANSRAFATTLVNKFLTAIKSNNFALLTKLKERLLASVSNAQENQVANNLSQLPNQLFKIIVDTLGNNSNTASVFVDFITSDTIRPHTAILKQIVTATISKISGEIQTTPGAFDSTLQSFQPVIQNIISGLVSNWVDQNADYADKNEVLSLVNQQLANQNLYVLLKLVAGSAIDNLNNNQFITDLKALVKGDSTKALPVVKVLISNPQTKPVLKQVFANLFDSIVTNRRLSKTLTKSLIQLSKTQLGITLDPDFTTKTVNIALDTLSENKETILQMADGLISGVQNLSSFTTSALLKPLLSVVNVNAVSNLSSSLLDKLSKQDTAYLNEFRRFLETLLPSEKLKTLAIKEINNQVAQIASESNSPLSADQKAKINSLLDKLYNSLIKNNADKIAKVVTDAIANYKTHNKFANFTNELLAKLQSEVLGKTVDKFIIDFWKTISDTEWPSYAEPIGILASALISNNDLMSVLINGLLPSELSPYSSDLVLAYKGVLDLAPNLKGSIKTTITNALKAVVPSRLTKLEDVLVKFIAHIDLSLKPTIINVVKNGVSNNSIKTAISKIAAHYLEKYVPTLSNKTQSQAIVSEALPHIVSILDIDGNTLEAVVTKVFDVLGQAKQATTVAEVKAKFVNLPADIFNIYKQKLGAFVQPNGNIGPQWVKLFNKIQASPLLKDQYKPYVRSILHALIDQFKEVTGQNAQIYTNLLNSLIPNSNQTAALNTYLNFIIKDANSTENNYILDRNLVTIVKDLASAVLDIKITLPANISFKDFVFRTLQAGLAGNVFNDNFNTAVHNLVSKALTNLNDSLYESILNVTNINQKLVSLGLLDNTQSGLTKETVKQILTTVKSILELNPTNPLILNILSKVKTIIADRNITNFDGFSSRLSSELLSFLITDFSVVKEVISSQVIRDTTQRNIIKKIAKKAVTKYVTYDWFISQLRANQANLARSLNLDATKVSQAINAVIADSQITDALRKVIELLPQNIESIIDSLGKSSLESFNSYGDVLKVILSNNSFETKLKDQLYKIVERTVANTKVRELVTGPVLAVLNDPELAPIFSVIQNKQAFVNSFLGIYSVVDNHAKLSRKVVDAVFAQLKINGLQIQASDVVFQLLQQIFDQYKTPEGQKQLNALIKAVVNDSSFGTLRTGLNSVFNNLFSKRNTDVIAASIASSVIKNLGYQNSSQINKNDVKLLFSRILTNDDFLAVAKRFTTNALSDSTINRLKSSRDIQQVYTIVADAINLAPVKTNITNFLRYMVKNSDTQRVLVKLIKAEIAKLNIDLSNRSLTTDQLLTDLLNNGYDLLNELDVFNATIDAVDKAIKAHNFTGIPVAISNVLTTKITNNIGDFARKFLNKLTASNNNILQRHKFTVVYLSQEIFGKLAQNHTLSNIVKGMASKGSLGNSGVLQAVQFANFKDVLSGIVANESFISLGKELIKALLDDLSWKDQLPTLLSGDLNQIYGLLHKFVKNNPAFKSKFTGFLQNVIPTILSHEKSVAIANDVTTYLTKQYGITIKNAQIQGQIVRTLLMSLNTFIKQDANTTNPLLTTLLQNVVNLVGQQDTYVKFQNNLNGVLTRVLDTSNVSVLKKGLLFASLLNDHSEAIVELITSTLSSTNTQLVDNFAKYLQTNFKTDLNNTKTFIKTVFNKPQFKPFVRQLVVKSLKRAKELTSHNSFEAINSLSQLINKLFEFNTQDKNDLIQSISQFIDVIIDDDTTRGFLADLVFKQLDSYPSLKQKLFKNISNPSEILKVVLKVVKITNKTLKANNGAGLYYSVLDKLFETLRTANHTQVAKPLVDTILGTLEIFTSKENGETYSINVIKAIFSDHSIISTANQNGFIQLIENAYDLVVEGDAALKIPTVSELIWSMLPDTTKEFISTKIVDQSLIKKAIQSAARNNTAIKKIIKDTFSYLFNNPTLITNAHGVIDILKNYVNSNGNEVKNTLKEIVLQSLRDSEVKKLLDNVIFEKFIKGFAKLNNPNRYQRLVQEFTHNLDRIVKDWGLLDSIVDTIVETIKTSTSVGEVTKAIQKQVQNAFDITNYSTFKKLLKDQIFRKSQNVTDLKQLVSDLVDKFLNTELINGQTGADGVSRIGKLVRDLKIPEVLLGSNSEADARDITSMMEVLVNSNGLKTFIKKFFNTIIDNKEQFYADSVVVWQQALKKVLEIDKNHHRFSIKDSFKEWLKEVLTPSNPKSGIFYKTLARVVISKLNNSGFRFNWQVDQRNFEAMMKAFFEHLTTTRFQGDWSFNTIIDRLFYNLSTTNYQTGIAAAQFNDDVINGLISIILQDGYSNKNNSISLHQVLNRVDLLNSIRHSKYMTPEIYVSFINRLFDASDFDRRTGIYGVLSRQLDIYKTNTPATTNNNGFTPRKYNFAFDENLISLHGKLTDFIKSLYTMIWEHSIEQAHARYIRGVRNGFDFVNYKNNEGYKAAFRLTTIFLWFTNKNMGNSYWWWNGIGPSVEGYINGSSRDAAYDTYFRNGRTKALLDEMKRKPNWNGFKLSDVYNSLGITKDGWWFNDTFVQGARSYYGVYQWNYNPNSLQAIIWFKDYPYRGNTGIKGWEALWQGLRDGNLERFLNKRR